MRKIFYIKIIAFLLIFIFLFNFFNINSTKVYAWNDTDTIVYSGIMVLVLIGEIIFTPPFLFAVANKDIQESDYDLNYLYKDQIYNDATYFKKFIKSTLGDYGTFMMEKDLYIGFRLTPQIKKLSLFEPYLLTSFKLDNSKISLGIASYPSSIGTFDNYLSFYFINYLHPIEIKELTKSRIQARWTFAGIDNVQVIRGNIIINTIFAKDLNLFTGARIPIFATDMSKLITIDPELNRISPYLGLEYNLPKYFDMPFDLLSLQLRVDQNQLLYGISINKGITLVCQKDAIYFVGHPFESF